MPHEPDLLELAAAWRSEGRQVALATVVATWGSRAQSRILARSAGWTGYPELGDGYKSALVNFGFKPMQSCQRMIS